MIFSRLKLLINILRKKELYFYKGLKKYDLIIFDTIFPHPVSGFRLEEFTVLLSEIKKSKILVNPDAYNFLNTAEELHPIHINELVKNYPKFKNKIKPLKSFVNINTKLFYCLFISHIYKYIEILEKHQIPFVFTLYPGSDFQMNNEECNHKLRRSLSSKMFKKVIVTQKVTKDYLLKNNFCSEDQIEFIFGCVVPQNSLIKDLTPKQYFSQGKDTLDICFCAAKYMPRGMDKGYDVFIEVAHKLLLKYNFVKFHIVGGFKENDIDVTAILNDIHFYGYQDFDQLQGIFKKMDILISPNKPFLLRNGSFDGFPLGTVVEAALNSVMVMLSDGLEQNTKFTNGEEVVIIDSDSKLIETILEELINKPQRIAQIAKKGTLKFQEIYSNELQMTPRLKVLNNIISNS